MGKRQVRVIAVPWAVTTMLLAAVSAAMLWLLYFLSGKAYASDDNAFRALILGVMRPDDRVLSRSAVLASLMPLVANALLFVPWGFLMFVALDRPRRPRRLSYILSIAAGLLFALAVYTVQGALPTRVTTLTDCIANVAGVFAGAALGHMRKDVRVRFDF